MNKENTGNLSCNYQENGYIPHTWYVDNYGINEEQTYRIFIYKPDTTPPTEGFPIIYVLDANSVFHTFVEAMRIQMGRSEKTGVYPAIIVGIGYQTDRPFSPNRFYDFTRSIPHENLPPHPRGLKWPTHGGADHFISFIQNHLRVEIEKNLPVNKGKQTLFGHSLGGLFVLQTLYSSPHFFNTYIAGSPSIHWDSQFFKVQRKIFAEKIKQANLKLNVFIGVGELEKSYSSGMNKNAIEIYENLKRYKEYNMHVDFKEFKEENHGSVLLPLINRAIKLGSG